MTELDVWAVGAAPVILFVGGMCLTAWWEDRRGNREPTDDTTM